MFLTLAELGNHPEGTVTLRAICFFIRHAASTSLLTGTRGKEPTKQSNTDSVVARLSCVHKSM